MKTQYILCPDNGSIGKSLVKIKIPTHCPVCNTEIKVINRENNRTTFISDLWNNCCRDRFSTYSAIWKNQIQDYPNGLNCRKCNDHFPWAEPNQPDGTLICFACRSMGRR